MRFVQFLSTMAGRLFVLLLIGIVASATLALMLSERQRAAEMARIRYDRASERLGDFLAIADRVPPGIRDDLISTGTTGIGRTTGRETLLAPDTNFAERLSKRQGRPISARHADPNTCLGPAHAIPPTERFDCWVITARLSDGELLTLQLRSRVPVDGLGLNPTVVLVLAILMATLALIAARMAAAPLDDLSRAAMALGADLDRSPLPEIGPQEVRDAARAFNQMQTRLHAAVIERTQLLASITHDLQTPMTRLRLRLERVPDAALRSRLIDDLGTMQALIREGLDLARSNQTNEPFARLDLDHLLELVVEDAAVGGKPVRLLGLSGADVEVRPRAMQRCLANLVDNAVKYGGETEVSARRVGENVEISVRDHGPGIPPENLVDVLQPFVRLETTSTNAIDGIGLGLAIAKTLADSNAASLTLSNHPDGGLEARLIVKAIDVPGSTSAAIVS
jgi:signal transduction histidine kinase